MGSYDSLGMKQYLPMRDEEAWRFLERGRIMALATVDEEGKPHVTPLWYVVLDGKVYFRAHAYKRKIRNIIKNPWVSFTVEEGAKYTELKGLTVVGKAKLVEDKDRLSKVNQALMEKYSWERNYDEMPEEWRRYVEGLKRAVVEIEVKELYSWDNGKWLEGRARIG